MKATTVTQMNKSSPMQTIRQHFEYQVYDSPAELSPSDRELLEKAEEAVSTSYAPYSHYHVGSAVRLTNGRIFTGSNQENIAFPAGVCAERVAVFTAVSNFPDIPVDAIAITAVADSFEVAEPVPPCGVCRQAIMEYENKSGHKIRLVMGSQSGKVFIINGMESLLPLAFHENGLARPHLKT
jgi:cytidine deaminase